MQLAVPITIDEGNLTSNIPYIAPVGWISNSDYHVGYKVIYGGAIYVCILAHITAQQPDVSPLYWAATGEPVLDWNEGTTYAAGDIAYSFGDPAEPYYNNTNTFRHVYVSLEDGNLGNNPANSPGQWEFRYTIYAEYVRDRTFTTAERNRYVTKNRYVYEAQNDNARSDPELPGQTDWVKIGPARRWAMFDEKTQTRTIAPHDIITSTQVPGRIDTLVLMEVAATSVNVQIKDGATVVYDQDFEMLDDTGISDWFDYFYDPVEPRTVLVVRERTWADVLDPVIVVTVTNLDGVNREVGHLVAGTLRTLGYSQLGARLGFDDYSVIQADDFGNRYVVERGYTDWGKYQVYVEDVDVDGVLRLLKQRRAKPSVFIASDKYDSTVHFAIPKNVEMLIAYSTYSILELITDGF